LHEEMPKGERGLKGFQLWVNLPSKNKMMQPRYQEVRSKDIPEVAYGNQAVIRVIAGQVNEVDAPVKDIIAEPTYLDIQMQPDAEITLPVHVEHNAFLYVFEGRVSVGKVSLAEGYVGLLGRSGDSLRLQAAGSGARFLLAAGKPLEEPIAWYGPIVMNTNQELEIAIHDLQRGSFIK
jgi:redox-sensitive bicupin YhaK (pirin superfamily)